MKRLCKLCGKNTANVPDREQMGSPRKTICRVCHGARLAGDLEYIMKVRAKREEGA